MKPFADGSDGLRARPQEVDDCQPVGLGRRSECGTLLTVVESGFDGIPAARRDKAFEMNDRGWAGQMKQIEKYLSADG